MEFLDVVWVGIRGAVYQLVDALSRERMSGICGVVLVGECDGLRALQAVQGVRL